MVAKLALLILMFTSTGMSVLVVRQQRLVEIGAQTEAALQASTFDRKLWQLRTEIAALTAPPRIREMAQQLEESYGPLTPFAPPLHYGPTLEDVEGFGPLVVDTPAQSITFPAGPIPFRQFGL